MSAAELVEVLADEGIEVDVAAAEAIQALIIELGGLSEAVEALRAIDIRNAA